MPFRIPALCSHCGFIGPSWFAISEGTRLESRFNAINCTRCGNFARLLDGDYEAISDTLAKIEGGYIDYRDVATLIKTIQRLIDEKETDPQKAAEEIRKQTGTVFERIAEYIAANKNAFRALAMVAVWIVSNLPSCKHSAKDELPQIINLNVDINVFAPTIDVHEPNEPEPIEGIEKPNRSANVIKI
jgi:hypothetical protein